MRLAIELSKAVTDAEVAEWMDDAFRDTWTYDLEPYLTPRDPWQTYEAYYDDERQSYRRPDPKAAESYRIREIAEVEGVEDLVWVPLQAEGSVVGYFSPFGDAWLPVTTPTLSGLKRTYVV